MKKHLLFLFIFSIVAVNAQIMPAYTPQSFDSYARPFQEYSRAFRQAEAQINELTNIVINALAKNIDDIARRGFNSDYTHLQSLSKELHENGLSQNIWSGINSVRISINNHIVNYNERVKIEKTMEEVKEEEIKHLTSWSGTGFALNQGHIVTNYHVVEGANSIKVKGIKGDFNTEYNAKVVATDKINDIAVIRIEDDHFTSFGAIPYKIKKSMSEVGESVWALGYPMTAVMGEEIKFTDGKISSRTGIQGDLSMYQISVPIQPGNSGGPLFDNNGNIIGITSAGLNREQFNSENVNYAIKTSYLYNLLESTLTTSILPQGTSMQGQPLTEKIKLAKKFVYMILCSPKDENDLLEEIKIINSTLISKESNSSLTKIIKQPLSLGLDTINVGTISKYSSIYQVYMSIKANEKDMYILKVLTSNKRNVTTFSPIIMRGTTGTILYIINPSTLQSGIYYDYLDIKTENNYTELSVVISYQIQEY